MEKTFREMIGPNTKSNFDIKKVLEDDEKYLNINPSKVQYGGNKKIGIYEVVNYQGDVIVYSKTEVAVVISVYEGNGFEIVKEKELVVAYGHEEIVLYLLDGTIKTIRTR